MTLPKRHEVPVEETWNLEDLFKTEEQYDAAIAQAFALADEIAAKHAGHIQDAASIIAALEAQAKLLEVLIPAGNYARLALASDSTDNAAQMRSANFAQTQAQISAKTAFIKSDILALDDAILEEAIAQAPQFEKHLNNLLKQKPYLLHPEVEKAVAAFGATLNGAYALYNTTKLVDLQFPQFEVNGEKHTMSYNLYEGQWDAEADFEKRRAAFDAFYGKLADYQHTTAATYNMQVKREKTEATLRGYDSVIDYLLVPQDVDSSLYHRQIDVIMEELAPHMRRYAKLLQKQHGIDNLTFADLKVPFDTGYEPTVSIDESRQYLKDGLAILGEDYVNMLDRAFDERWIDFANNAGKSTGAFCTTPYGSHPYVLISWTSRMNEVFVLSHELGHAGHFYLANEHQNVFNASYSMYFVEAPSTMNEMLMTHHLLQTNDDARFKRWVLSTVVSRTYYHNFVTHLLEAAYQRKVYEIVDAGGNVNAPKLNALKREVLEQFWGDTVEINDGAELTWMRQPHYYMGLYPYTYSAGLTISTQVSKRILEEGEPAVADWLNVLKAGSTKSPVELAAMAGLDITTDQPLRDTIAYIGNLIDEIEKLTEEIEGAKA